MTPGIALAVIGILFTAGGSVVAITRGFSTIAEKLESIVHELREFKGTAGGMLDRHAEAIGAHSERLATLEAHLDRRHGPEDRRE